MKVSYLSVAYDEREKPLTNYPFALADYLTKRFGFQKGYKLLDTGCGRAEMLNAFAKNDLSCFGCDKEAPPEGRTECEIKEFDLVKDRFPYPDNHFNVVFSKSVLEHIYDPSQYLSEVYRILVSGGIFIVLTPDWKSQHITFFEDPTHVHPYLPQAVKSLLKLSGFRDAEAEAFNHHELIWGNWFWRNLARVLRWTYSTPTGRMLTRITGIKYFRWAVEQNVLGFGYK